MYAFQLGADVGRLTLARTLQKEGIVESISPQSVQRILASYKLRPWRVHHWLSSKVPRDTAFRAQVVQLCELYTRKLSSHELVLCLDERPLCSLGPEQP